MNKYILHTVFLLLITGGLSGDCESGDDSPDKMFFHSRNISSKSLRLIIQKVTSAVYLPWDNSVVMAVEPVAVGENNIFKFVFDHSNENENPFKAYDRKITNGPIRLIQTSLTGEYMALTGRTRELVLLKNELQHKVFYLEDEITAMEFDENGNNILALGDRSGKLIIIDVEKASILDTFEVLNDEITSLTFYKNSQLLLVGKGSHVHQVDINLKKIVRTIETESLKRRILRLLGFVHCAQQRINKVLYIRSIDKIVTTHGWDYCKDNRVGIWDGTSGLSFKEMNQFKFPIYHLAWVSKSNTLVLVDHNESMWRFKMDDYSLSNPISLPNSMTYLRMENGKPISHKNLFGHVQSMVTIPGKSILLLGLGSYSKGGPGLLLTKLNSDHQKNLARVVMGRKGQKHLYLNEELYYQFKPPSVLP